MTLQPGARLGPYEVISPAGAGGMGEVYRAHDPRLQRVVAIKILPAHVSQHKDLKGRFFREAQTLASFSHPHICSVFDVGSEQGVDYLVMEYLEGQTLAERLHAGALPIDEVLAIAVQLADALDAAHRRQIIHRDLKPGNVMLTKAGVRLLDFGLAKLAAGGPSGQSASDLPTAMAMTGQGEILGTPQYMAPEQIEGREADARTDVFAMGAVIYEMTTGRRAFEGGTSASVMAAILNREPPAMSSPQTAAPVELDRIVKKCLAKDPEERWQTARDLGTVLKWVADGSATPIEAARRTTSLRERSIVWWAVISTLLVIALGVATIGTRRDPPTSESIRLDLLTPAGADPTDIALAPNGRSIAFTGFTTDRATAIFVRDLSTATVRQLGATEGAVAPFWSPDGRYLAFWAGGRLSKIPVAGGPPVFICDVEGYASGTWGRDNTIIIAAAGNLYQVASDGGQPQQLSKVDQAGQAGQELEHQSPQFLPDGRGYVYLAWSLVPANRAIYVSELGSQGRTRLVAAQSKPWFAEPGYLLYHRDGVLVAHPFDAARRVLTGEPTPIVEGVALRNVPLSGNAAFSAANGTLIYRSGSGLVPDREFVWFDRSGTTLGPSFGAGPYTTNFDMTEDGTRVAVARRDPAGSRYDIWLFGAPRTTPMKATFDRFLSSNGNVVFSPDARRIAYTSERNGARDIFTRQTDGTGDDSVLLDLDVDVFPEDWSKDDRYLIFGVNAATAAGGIYALPLFGDRKPFPVVQSRYTDDEPRLSFDGKWLAYASNESGTFQVYVVAFSAGDRKRQISSAGGTQPRWRRDGRELYYLALDGTIMAADIRADASVGAGAPRALFNARIDVDPLRDQFAVTGDGRRILVQRLVVESSSAIRVVTTWTTLLTGPRDTGKSAR